MSTSKQGYSMGHGKEATGSHATRTPQTDAEFMLRHLQPDDYVLDVGCGPGTITTGLCDLVPWGFVIGIDISPDVLLQAADLANARPKGCPTNLDFFAVDVLKPGWAEDKPDKNAVEASALPATWKDKFNVIFESQLFVHISDPVGVIQKLRPCLKEGGMFALRDYDIESFTFHPDPSGKLKRWGEYQSLLVLAQGASSAYGGRDLYGYVRKAGFPPEKIILTMSSTIYRGPEQIKWWGELHAERLADGKPQRKRLIGECGVTAEEIEEVRGAILRWAKEPDGIWSATSYEVIART